MSEQDEIQALLSAAVAARRNAYAPYSGFLVGAAIRTTDGKMYAGCNVENAAYPQSQCAEGTAIGLMVADGGRRIAAILVVGGEPGDGKLCTPCGGCRQRIREFAAPDTPVYVCGPEGLRRTFTMEALLPSAFGPDNLEPGQ